MWFGNTFRCVLTSGPSSLPPCISLMFSCDDYLQEGKKVERASLFLPHPPHQCLSTFRYLPLPLFVCHDLLYTWAWTISGYLSVCSDLTSFPWQAPRTHAVPCEMKQVGKHPAAPSVGDCYLCFISLFPLSFTTALFALFPMFLSLKGEKNYLLLISNGL